MDSEVSNNNSPSQISTSLVTPKKQTFLAILLSLTTCYFLFNAYYIIAVLETLNKATIRTGLYPYHIMSVMPIVCLMPLLYAIFVPLLIYPTLKIKSASKKVYKLTIITLIMCILGLILFFGLGFYQSNQIRLMTNNY